VWSSHRLTSRNNNFHANKIGFHFFFDIFESEPRRAEILFEIKKIWDSEF